MWRAGAILPRRDADGQRRLLEWLEDSNTGGGVGSNPPVAFRTFAESVLGWEFLPEWYAVRNELPPDLPAVHLPEYAETLFADFAVREPDVRPATPPPAARDAANGMSPWQLVVALYGPNQDLDKTFASEGRLNESPNGRMERLLRATGIPAGLVWGGRRIRLVSAPRGESSGYLDFVLDNMVETAGRPLLAALRLLLSQDRLLSLPTNERLPALLSDSRKYQNEVSERLADQVLHGLYDLLRGIQAADAARSGALLRDPLRGAPDDVYRALLAVILRLVFLLYAEQRGLLPDDDETFGRHYSLMALFERLRADEAFHPDTMDQRYGAWAHLLALFRMVHDGARSDRMRLPPRHGALFDPNRYPFLEGRIAAGGQQLHERIEPPLLSDGTVLAVLKKLLILDGERISYRALDVEQIGSVYETMMGFRLERAEGPSVAVKSPKKHGAPSVVNLEALLSEPSGSRGRWVQQATDRKLTERVLKAVASASSVERLHAALDPAVDRSATPDIAQVGSLLLQPNEERRRSGSHYTPRALTEPIVRARWSQSSSGCGRPPGGAHRARRRSSTSRSATRRWVPGRSWWRRAASWATRSSRRGRSTADARRFRPTRTRPSSPAASLPRSASTAWTGTRSRWTSPSCLSGWSRWRKTTRSPSWTTRSGPGTRWRGCPGGRSGRSTGGAVEAAICSQGRPARRWRGCTLSVARSGRRGSTSPTTSAARSGRTRNTNWRASDSTGTW